MNKLDLDLKQMIEWYRSNDCTEEEIADIIYIEQANLDCTIVS